MTLCIQNMSSGYRGVILENVINPIAGFQMLKENADWNSCAKENWHASENLEVAAFG